MDESYNDFLDGESSDDESYKSEDGESEEEEDEESSDSEERGGEGVLQDQDIKRIAGERERDGETQYVVVWVRREGEKEGERTW
jgi:hypothetical protein